jgi:hypothetical protein
MDHVTSRTRLEGLAQGDGLFIVVAVVFVVSFRLHVFMGKLNNG